MRLLWATSVGTGKFDDVLIGRAASGKVDVYVYKTNKSSYVAYTSFNAFYAAGGALAVNDLGPGSPLNAIVVGNPVYGTAYVIAANKPEGAGTYQFAITDILYDPSLPLATADEVGAGYWSGRRNIRVRITQR